MVMAPDLKAIAPLMDTVMARTCTATTDIPMAGTDRTAPVPLTAPVRMAIGRIDRFHGKIPDREGSP